MASTLPLSLVEIEYYDAAQRYLRSLPPEHFMEAFPQGTQRMITIASLQLLRDQRPDVYVFNELLVQYPLQGRKIGQVVPDNMVVISEAPLIVEGSFDLPLQPEGPFLVLEYVSQNSKRKDYVDNKGKYEQDLKVPYCLLFYPEKQDLKLLKYDKETGYHAVVANKRGRMPIPKLELEVALHEEWVRFWFRGELLPLPADLLLELDETKRLLAGEREALAGEREARIAAEHEVERLRALLEKHGDLPPP